MSAIREHDVRAFLAPAWRLGLRGAIVAAALVAMTAGCAGSCGIGSASIGIGSDSSGWPWGTDSVTPADLAKELASASGADKPVVVCTAPPFLYRVGHIPGAVLHGPASSPEGLTSLTTWAQTLPRSTSVVIYCGCCPLAQCPNLSPAYRALKGLGFTRVRVLPLETNFKTDWVDPGYPFER
jgi:thiosulfate/3-mercaptopyruvate sulfurtransferase